MVRNTGIHAAAVVIADRPLTDIVPLRAGDHGDQVITQFEQADVEALGLLKMDVLGLRNLDVLKKVRDFIKDSKGTDLDVGAIPLDDAKTFEMIARGDTTACSSSSPRACRPPRDRSSPPASRTSSPWWRCTGRPDGVHPDVRGQQARPLADQVRRPAAWRRSSPTPTASPATRSSTC